MPKALSRKRVASEEYESDGGFVEDAPKTKKSKATAGSDAASLDVQKDDDGNDFWEISRTRRVQVSEFKGNTMISIREFYEKDGKMLPGKKGISLNLEQYNTVLQLLPGIETALKKKGVKTVRPVYEQADVTVAASEDSDDSTTRPERSASKLKANHEATSDEDDD